MNKKGFANLMIIIVIIIIAAAVGYFALVKKSVNSTNDQISQTKDETNDKKTLLSNNEPTSQTSSITVISPNGGEVWEEGKEYTIRWLSKNLPEDANIAIFLSRGKRTGNIENNKLIARGIPSHQTSHNWKIDINSGWGELGYDKRENLAYSAVLASSHLQSTAYIVRVAAYLGSLEAPDYSVMDESNATFSIIQ